MSDPGTLQLLATGLNFVPALLWTVVAADLWCFLRKRQSRGAVFLILFVLGCLVAVHFSLWTLWMMIPLHLGTPSTFRGLLLALIDATVVAVLSVGRHFALIWPVRARPPTAAWLGVNYGTAFVAVTAIVLADLRLVDLSPTVHSGLFTLFPIYLVWLATMAVRDVRRLARSGVWRPGRFGELSSADVASLTLGLAFMVAAQLVPVAARTTPLSLMTRETSSPAALWFFGLQGAAGIAFAVCFVVRDLADVLRGFVAAAGALGATAGLYFGARRLGGRLADPELRRLVDFAAVLGVAFVLIPGQVLLRGALDQVVFRRSRRRWAELQAFLQHLSPELGVAECCRRVLAGLARAMQFRGVAIMLADAEPVVHGEFALAPLERVWSGCASALPPHALGQSGFRGLPLPLLDALTEADVVAIIPVVSPRRLWGHVLVRTDLLGASFSDEDDQALDAVADQLALLLDGAELLARTRAVERSLAHAEQLAAIGELAARIAHEIRNPITAARSLAQQLVQEESAFGEEHRLILAELERVEKQVAALLRFARREEFRFEGVDLGELARATVAGFQTRLEAAGVGVELELADGVTARADREKMRQVLINLIENALDALAASPAPRCVGIGVGTANGSALLRVTDSGPGVPADVLPHLFEPFYSRKEAGTGLGLAIAKRTVDAHGGRIELASQADAGMTVRIELPLARPPEGPPRQ